MAIYVIEFITILLLGMFPKQSIRITRRKGTSSINICLVVTFILLWAVMAFRAPSVGTDTKTYYMIYQKIANSGSLKEAMDVSTISSAPVYVAYAFALSKIFKSYQAIVILNASIVSIGFYRFIKKTSKNYMFSCYLFLALTMYFEAMNGTRQFVAMSIGLNAFLVLKENIKDAKAWIAFLIASLIHNTVIILVIGIIGALLVNRTRNVEKVLSRSLIICAAIAFGFRFFILLIVRWIPYFEQYINGDNNAQIFNSSGSGRIIILYGILLAGVMIFTYMAKKRGSILQNMDYSIYPSVVFCAVCGIAFSKNILFNRILWGFMCLYIPFIPNAYSLIKPKETRIALSIITGALLFIYCAFHLIEDKSSIIPYIPFWTVL